MFETTNVAADVGKGVTPFNPLQTLEGIANLRNTLNQNRMFQGKQAAAAAFQNSIGPDGSFDQNKFMSNLRDAPNALEALGAGQAGASLTGTNIQNATGLQTKAQGALDFARKAVGGLADSPSLSPQAVGSMIDAMASSGSIPAEMAASIKSSMPTDPGQLRSYLQNGFQFPAMGADAMFEAQHPAPSAIATGPKIVLTQAPRIGTPTAVGTLDVGLSPSEANTPAYSGFDPNTNAPYTVTKGAAAVHPPSGEIQSGPALGAEAQANAAAGPVGAQSGNTFAHYADAVVKARETKANAQLLEGYLADKDFKTGPQTKIGASLGAIAQGLGLPVPDSIKNGTAATEDFRHYATNILATQTASLGGTGTDAAREKAAQITPSEIYSKLGDKGIIAGIKGNADAQVVMGSLSRQWLAHHPNTTGADFQNWFQKHYNPLVFTAQYLDPKQQAQLFSGMSSEAKAQYKTDALYAIKNRYISPDASVGQ